MSVATDTLEAATKDLESAIEEVDDIEARYHIREAAQRVVIAGWKEDNDPDATSA